MSKEGFSPSRRGFIKKTFGAGAAVVLAPLEKVTKVFEDKDSVAEQQHIQNCLNEYNKKFPEIKDKIEEQKEWFLMYMDSSLYRNLLTREMENDLPVDNYSSREKRKVFRDFVNSEIEYRKLKIKNIKFFIDHNSYSSVDAYTTSLTYEDVSDTNRVEYIGNRDDLPKEGKFLGVVVNEVPFNSDCVGNFEGPTIICHELHHISLTKEIDAKAYPIQKTDDFFKQNLVQNSLDSVQVRSNAEYILNTTENMARIIAVRKTLAILGKIKPFKEKFDKKHIEYIKKYLDDLFPYSSFIRYLFSGDFKKDGIKIDDQILLQLMNGFASVDKASDTSRLG